MKNNSRLLPELRFPEFKNDGEWEEKELEEILVKNSTKNKLSKYSLVQSVSNKYGFINQDEYFDNRRVASIDTANYYVIEQGTFAYNPSRIDVGSLAYKKDSETSIISPLYVSFKVKNKLINDEFLLSWFSSENFKKQMIFEGGVRNTLNFENLIKIRVNIPKNPLEQQKIADCLSSLDELLADHTEKLTLLQNHKKGLLRNLFPQGDSKIPEYRFKEFENDGEWKYLNGNELFEPISNKNHNSDLPILAITQDKGAVPRDEINYHVIASEKSIESYKVVEIGDFIISLRSFQGGIEYSNYKGICSPAYIILRKIFDYSVNDFYRHYFKSDLYIKNLNKNLEGIRDGKMISYTQFSEILLPNPSPKEQQKIADTLSSLDNLINAQTQKITQLQQHKKGLLQGLFPKINE